jgi:hypothetical protein
LQSELGLVEPETRATMTVTDTLCEFGEYPEIYADCLGECR